MSADPGCLRAAAAADADAAVPLIFSSGPAAYSQVFTLGDHSAEDFLRFAFVEGSGFCGFRNHLVMDGDDAICATVSFYTQAEHGRLSRESLLQSTRFFGVTGTVRVVRQSLPVSQMMPVPPADTLYIANLAVASGCRGRGLGATILRQATETARLRGLAQCCLDVAVSNERARALYIREGFQPLWRRDWPAKTNPWGVPDHQRMIKRL